MHENKNRKYAQEYIYKTSCWKNQWTTAIGKNEEYVDKASLPQSQKKREREKKKSSKKLKRKAKESYKRKTKRSSLKRVEKIELVNSNSFSFLLLYPF